MSEAWVTSFPCVPLLVYTRSLNVSPMFVYYTKSLPFDFAFGLCIASYPNLILAGITDQVMISCEHSRQLGELMASGKSTGTGSRERQADSQAGCTGRRTAEDHGAAPEAPPRAHRPGKKGLCPPDACLQRDPDVELIGGHRMIEAPARLAGPHVSASRAVRIVLRHSDYHRSPELHARGEPDCH